uniref:Uncharacterized protein n=1 Tax=Arion vulgaris TaxID=1028688 RepID=A0A0B7BY94_9EUPU
MIQKVIVCLDLRIVRGTAEKRLLAMIPKEVQGYTCFNMPDSGFTFNSRLVDLKARSMV